MHLEIDDEIRQVETRISGVRTGLRLNANIGYLNTKIANGASIDTFDRTGGSPLLTLVKSSSACVRSSKLV